MGCHNISEAGDGGCPVMAALSMTPLLAGGFGAPFFILGIVGCLIVALARFCFPRLP
jgi:hypothetical protein